MVNSEFSSWLSIGQEDEVSDTTKIIRELKLVTKFLKETKKQ